MSDARWKTFRTRKNTLLHAMVEQTGFPVPNYGHPRLHIYRPAIAFDASPDEADDQYLDLVELAAFARHFRLKVPDELLGFVEDSEVDPFKPVGMTTAFGGGGFDSSDDGDRSKRSKKVESAQAYSKRLTGAHAIIAGLLPLAFRDATDAVDFPLLAEKIEELLQHLDDPNKEPALKADAISGQISDAINRHEQVVANSFKRRTDPEFGGKATKVPGVAQLVKTTNPEI